MTTSVEEIPRGADVAVSHVDGGYKIVLGPVVIMLKAVEYLKLLLAMILLRQSDKTKAENGYVKYLVGFAVQNDPQRLPCSARRPQFPRHCQRQSQESRPIVHKTDSL
jgi:hypothetical protein